MTNNKEIIKLLGKRLNKDNLTVADRVVLRRVRDILKKKFEDEVLTKEERKNFEKIQAIIDEKITIHQEQKQAQIVNVNIDPSEFVNAIQNQSTRLAAIFIKQDMKRKGLEEINNKRIDDAIKLLSILYDETQKINSGVEIKNFPEFPKSFSVENPVEEVSIKGAVKVEQDLSTFAELITALFTGVITFFTQFLPKLASQVFRVKLENEHYTTPQTVVLFDPSRNSFANLEELFKTNIISGGTMGGLNGNVFIKGADTIQDGIGEITAGTPLQLPAQGCHRVIIQADENNTGVVVVGGATVNATAGSRRGLALYSSQYQTFNVSDLSNIYIDGTHTGDKFNYYVEI